MRAPFQSFVVVTPQDPHVYEGDGIEFSISDSGALLVRNNNYVIAAYQPSQWSYVKPSED